MTRFDAGRRVRFGKTHSRESAEIYIRRSENRYFSGSVRDGKINSVSGREAEGV
jgi:hypothetical protein